ncbi:hypothetical protein FKV68_12445 [Sinorhizobium mexicanum]|uniref:Uncharacterized protein n=1 Tax=Sinorhizobium mexicanum TaxID=375549 RepID=A0A859QCL4_9HYPH|nr:hypothetical protein FKV68_12445 [Sinorhizobium mexicanum]
MRDSKCWSEPRASDHSTRQQRAGFARTPSSPSSLCSSQGSSSAASAARKSPFSPRTWADRIPVTSTGMRVGRSLLHRNRRGSSRACCGVLWRSIGRGAAGSRGDGVTSRPWMEHSMRAKPMYR